MTPEPQSITLDQAEFQRLVHLGSSMPLDQVPDADRPACELIGQFFAKNLWLAQFAFDVTQITLVLRDGQPLQVNVAIVRDGVKFGWATGPDGIIPVNRRLARRIYRQWAREKERADGG